MLLAYDWHVAQVVCETRIIISYVSNSLVPNSLIAASYCTQRSIKVSQKRSNWDFTYKSISHIKSHFLSNKVLSEEPKDGPDFEASLGYYNYAQLRSKESALLSAYHLWRWVTSPATVCTAMQYSATVFKQSERSSRQVWGRFDESSKLPKTLCKLRRIVVTRDDDDCVDDDDDDSSLQWW